MKVTAYKTPLVKAGDDLFEIIAQSISTIPERSILVVASKIVSTCENRFVPKGTGSREEKHALVKQEAEYYTDPRTSKYDVMLTIKGNWIFANAGIDESNADDQYILWPKDPQQSVNEIWQFLRQHYGLKEVGVTMSDSASMPLNWGVTGHAIAHCGFNSLRSYIGKPDLFGRPMKMEQVNVKESVTVAATLEMGEGAEQTPLGLVENINDLEFVDHVPTPEELEAQKISPEDDIFAPILTKAEWHPAPNEYEAALRQSKPIKEMKNNQEVLLLAAKELGYEAEKIGDFGLLAVTVKGKKQFLFHSYSPLNTQLGSHLVKNKYVTRKVLETNGYQNIPYCLPSSSEQVETFFNQHQPVIAKPVNGSNSFAVFKIETLEELRKVPYQKYFFEKYIKGTEYRYLVLNGEVIKVDRRVVTPEPDNPWKKQTTSLTQKEWDQVQVDEALKVADLFKLGFCAVDYLLDDQGMHWLLEVNGSPALTRNGSQDILLAKEFLWAWLETL
jgi:F420-0:gamma-glutamyl ligase